MRGFVYRFCRDCHLYIVPARSISHIVEENMVVRSTIYFFNVDLHIPYETKPGLIVSTNELEIVNTRLMKGTFFGEEIENKVRPAT